MTKKKRILCLTTQRDFLSRKYFQQGLFCLGQNRIRPINEDKITLCSIVRRVIRFRFLSSVHSLNPPRFGERDVAMGRSKHLCSLLSIMILHSYLRMRFEFLMFPFKEYLDWNMLWKTMYLYTRQENCSRFSCFV